MTSEKNCYRKQKRLKKYRQRVNMFFYMMVLIILCGVFWMLGKNAGKKETINNLILSIREDELILSEDFEDLVTEQIVIKENVKPLLVNKENPLPEDYQVELLTLPDGVNRAAVEAYEPLCDMLKAGRQEGLNFEICSSYRDAARQRELFEEDVAALMGRGYSYTEAYEEVAKETMPPGCSEHSTGLAFDIVALNYQMLDEGQEKTAENKWLREHCAEYGFILRYPKGKEDITLINYESWHFRYVGKEIAEYIMKNGITLEEYLEKE